MNEIVKSSEPRSRLSLFSDFDDIFDDFWRPVRSTNGRLTGGAFSPALDVSENDDEYRVRADLPGVKKDDVDISIHDGILTINAETKYEEDQKAEGRVIRQERRYGKFVRSMRLGDAVNVDHVNAKLKDGVLHLVLPKAEKAKPKKIEVAVN